MRPGLEIFFVLSGFCIHLSFSRQPQDWKLFQKLFFRIYPPYLAALLFFALVYPKSKLQLELEPAISEDIIISQENVSAFKEWMGQ